MRQSSYITDFEHWLERVKDLPIFQSLDLERAKCLLAHCRVRQFEPGELVITEGKDDGLIYILASGQVRVEKSGVVLSELHRLGDIFGEMSQIEGLPRSASVRAVTKALCMAVDMSLINGLTGQEKVLFQAAFYRALAEKLAEKLRRTDVELVRTQNTLANLERTVELKTQVLEKYRRAGLA